MKLRAELFLLRHTPDHILGKLLRLEGAEPHALDARYRAGRFDRVAQVQAEFLPVGRKVDTGQNDLSKAVCGERVKLPAEILERLGAHAAARIGDDAVGAEAVAAVLNFQKCPCSVVEFTDFQRLKGFLLFMGNNINDALVGGKVCHNVRKQGGTIAVSQYNIGIAQFCGFFRKGLWHTAG